MEGKSEFQCVGCSKLYVHSGRWDLPRCPRCGAMSSLFPEWVQRRRRSSRR
jgi:hypothetical protein